MAIESFQGIRYIVVSDDSAHKYLIPENTKDEFRKWEASFDEEDREWNGTDFDEWRISGGIEFIVPDGFRLSRRRSNGEFVFLSPGIVAIIEGDANDPPHESAPTYSNDLESRIADLEALVEKKDKVLLVRQDRINMRDRVIAELEQRLFKSKRDYSNMFSSPALDAEIWAEVRAGSPLARNVHEDLAALTAAAKASIARLYSDNQGVDVIDALSVLEKLIDSQASKV